MLSLSDELGTICIEVRLALHAQIARRDVVEPDALGSKLMLDCSGCGLMRECNDTWRCCCNLSRARFGDELVVAITIWLHWSL